MDHIPRKKSVTRDMEMAANSIIEALETVKGLHDIFDFLEPEAYRQQAEDILLQVGTIYCFLTAF